MRKLIYLILCPLLLASCIENDVPYPIVEALVTAIEVEGQTDAEGNEGGAATINKSARTIQLYVGDEVSLDDIRIDRLLFTEEAVLSLTDTTQSRHYHLFPRTPFASTDNLAVTADTRLDCTSPVVLRLTTYQQYDWTLNVTQIVRRELLLDDQIGDAVIDDVNHNVVIYVDKKCDLKNIHVQSFTLGGPHGTVAPDPTENSTFDFSDKCTFTVKRAFDRESTKWDVYVYKKDPSVGESRVFPMSKRATVSGRMLGSAKPVIEYRKKNSAAWQTLGDEAIAVSGQKYTATLTALSPATNYLLRVTMNGITGDEQAFTTAPAPQLTDGSFDNWHTEGNSDRPKWNPWAEGAESFWDTGNQGATTVGKSNSVPTDDTCDGRGQAALLESKYIVIKFAAGNIFTGRYAETDGTNGILEFGRPFTGCPTALRVNYKFLTSTVTRSADEDYKYLIGRPDSCQIYIALADWDKPYEIRTRPSTRHLFNPHDPGVIAYAQITVGDDVPTWKQEDLVLNYYPEALGRTPKYILVVASASKYGDFFAGGEGTKLWVDNFELIYD